MKKILFAAAAMAAALFASCDNADETIDPVIPEAADGARIAITLTGADDADTRAFFDSSAKAETWESSLSTLSVFAFDDADNLIIRRDFTSSELAAKSATFSLPKSAAGTECSCQHPLFILRRSELRRLGGQDQVGPYGPRGEVRRGL